MSPPVLPAFAPYAPYPVVLVELEEAVGLRLVGQVVRAPGAPLNALPAQALAIGAPVTASIEMLADQVYWPRWVLI